MHNIMRFFLTPLLLLTVSQAYANPAPCGEPKAPASPYKQHTLVVWQDCADLTWHVRAYHGVHKGTIFLSDPASMYTDEVSKTKNSRVTLHNGEMKATLDFTIVVEKEGASKEFSFAVPLYARMVLVMKPGSKAQVRYGNLLDTSGIVNLINPPDVEMHITEVQTQ